MASSCRDFDPRTRAFSDEELKPQPIIKKSRKQFVPDDLKDDKYWARRRKNNLAAKRSRDARRMKENQIALRAGYLEKEVNTSICTKKYYVSKSLITLFIIYEWVFCFSMKLFIQMTSLRVKPTISNNMLVTGIKYRFNIIMFYICFSLFNCFINGISVRKNRGNQKNYNYMCFEIKVPIINIKITWFDVPWD